MFDGLFEVDVGVNNIGFDGFIRKWVDSSIGLLQFLVRREYRPSENRPLCSYRPI